MTASLGMPCNGNLGEVEVTGSERNWSAIAIEIDCSGAPLRVSSVMSSIECSHAHTVGTLCKTTTCIQYIPRYLGSLHKAVACCSRHGARALA